MHILWINDHADFTGGCEHYIYQSVKLLTEQGIKSTLLFKLDAPVNPIFTRAFHGSYPMVLIEQQIAQLKPDIIYIHRISSLPILKILAKLKIKSIRFYHDHKTFCLREHKYTTLQKKTCTKKVGLNCYKCLGFVHKKNNVIGIGFQSVSQLEEAININKNLDYFVVGSKYMKKQLVLHDFPESKILTAPLFTSFNDFEEHQPSPTAPEQNKSNFLDRNLLFVGQLITGKGLDILLNSMKSLPYTTKLNVCGSGPKENNYKQQVKSLKLGNQVNFLGKQNKGELAKLYQSAIAVVIPSRAPETFCLVGIEALLHGIPVICSNVGGMSDWFKPNFNGLAFLDGSEKKLSTAIQKIISSPRFHKDLVQNILTDNYEQFKPQHHINLLKLTFSKLLEAS